jgi:hypothetical protein
MGIANRAFTEDRIMIEAQQRVINNTPARKVLPTSADMGVTLYNRLVDSLVASESAGESVGPQEQAAAEIAG